MPKAASCFFNSSSSSGASFAACFFAVPAPSRISQKIERQKSKSKKTNNLKGLKFRGPFNSVTNLWTFSRKILKVNKSCRQTFVKNLFGTDVLKANEPFWMSLLPPQKIRFWRVAFFWIIS